MMPDDLSPRTAGHAEGASLVHPPIVAKILVADDEPRNLLAVSEILAGPGIDVVLADSGEEALRRILRDDFAVILLDVRMPRIDGYELAAMIRARPRSSRVPILFLTAYNKEDVHVFRGYSAGAVDYVFKPIEPLILKSKVEIFVDLYRKTEEIKRQHAAEKELLLENLRVRSEKLEAERALRRGEEHQSLVLRGLPIALYTAPLGVSGRPLRFTGDNVETITGCCRSAFLDPAFWASRLPPEDRDRVVEELDAIATTEQTTVEYRWRRDDGTECHILDRIVLVRDDDGAPREIFGIWFDISERIELEQRLLHASKLEAVGRLTGGIAHDFNNMLNVVVGNLDLLLKTFKDDAKARRRIESAIQGAQRCADLTSRLLAFSRRSALKASVLDVRELMLAITALLKQTLGERIAVQLEIGDDVPPIRIDRSQLEAALVNLAVNARDAMPDGGSLRLEVRHHRPDERGAPSGPGTVEIVVEDSGVGMPPEVLEKIFEPFFTTKESGKGTGLGLSMVYGFVQQSGGDIVVDSEAGRGTTFRLTFPVSVERPREEQPPSNQPDAEGLRAQGEAVLLVEDDPAVREIAMATLESAGFSVIEAETGDEALAALDRDPRVKLVFSDVRMPGRLTGIELGEIVKERRPGVALLLTSGFTDEIADLAKFEFLQKPYRAAELLEKLETLFRPSRGSGHDAVPP